MTNKNVLINGLTLEVEKNGLAVICFDDEDICCIEFSDLCKIKLDSLKKIIKIANGFIDFRSAGNEV